MVMLNEESKDKLSKLEKKLYSRTSPEILDKGRTELRVGEDIPQVSEKWGDVEPGKFDSMISKLSGISEKRHTAVKRIFTASLVLFVISAAVAAFVFFGGGNLVSSKNVDIKVVGPLSVGGGQESSFDINVINSNRTDLKSVSILVEYPSGTRLPSDLSKELSRERFNLGDIESGDTKSQQISAVIFGDRESTKEFKFSLEYRVENSSAVFYKEKIHEITISSAPIIITPTYPKEVNSNQEINFSVEIASNSKDTLGEFLVRVEYPFGFVFKNASIDPAYGDNVWKFSRLGTGEKRVISINGTIIGQDNEERVFRITAGTQSDTDEKVIAVPISDLTETILVKKPFIGISSVIGENVDSDYAGRGGKEASVKLSVRNNLPTRIFNMTVEVYLKGAALDPFNVSAGSGGFYQSFNNTILWDKRSVGEFADMGPGSSKNLSFSLTPLVYSKITNKTSPEIEITIVSKGERVLESGSIENVSSTEKRKIILATDLELSSRSVRSLGSIENTGPIPPKAGVPTTYTIIWAVTNTFNQASNVEARTTLPPYVRWTGLFSPTSEAISYNQTTNQVVWNVGTVLPSTGISASPKQVYFQLELLPSVSQIGNAPGLMGDVMLTGIDKVTGVKMESRQPGATTNFSGDPTYKMGFDRVEE
jgi:hypothetical protein